jgi:hypothetical protein
MTRKNLYFGALVLGTAATLTLAVTLTLSISRSQRKPSPAASAPVLAQVTTPAASESKGAQKESIKVHGHWTIDVRNPDGTLVTHREFENAITPSGQVQLTKILGRVAKPGLWEIDLFSPVGNFASIYESNDTLGTPNQRTLSVCVGGTLCSVEGQTPPQGVFMVGGHIPAPSSVSIEHVQTLMDGCAPDDPANPCVTQPQRFLFTEHFLSSPVNVVAGQIIQVTVAISFL